MPIAGSSFWSSRDTTTRPTGDVGFRIALLMGNILAASYRLEYALAAFRSRGLSGGLGSCVSPVIAFRIRGGITGCRFNFLVSSRKCLWFRCAE